VALSCFAASENPRPPAQPVPFNHKLHAGVGLQCGMCHANAAKAERAGLPQAAQCMVCHAGIKNDSPDIVKLAGFQANQKPIPWARVYRLPDFIFFSHATHVNGKVACAECHGPVEQREALAAEVAHTMKSCMECHLVRKVTNECHVCHELGQ
jgi:hypothetical protein